MPPEETATTVKPEISAEDADLLVTDVLQSLDWAEAEPVPKEGEKKEEKKPEAKEEKEKKEEPEKPKPTVSKKAPPLDVKEMAREVAVETGKEVAKALKPKDPEPEEDFLDDAEKDDIQALERLEAKDAKYKGLAKKTKKFYEKVLRPYREEWERKNPKRDFNPADEEHSDIYAQQPEIDEGAFAWAKEDLKQARIEARLEEKWNQKYKPELDQLKRYNIEKELEPRIQARGQEVVDELLKQTAPELAEAMKELAGDEKWKEKLTAKDPIATMVLDRNARLARAVASEYEKLMTPELGYQFDPTTNPVHGEIANHFRRYEQKIKSMPPEDQLWQGKRFASLAEWSDMDESQRKGHWILDWKESRADFFAELIDNTKKIVAQERQRFETWATQAGYRKEETPPDKKKEESQAPVDKPKPKPPSMASSNDLVTTSKGPGTVAKTFEESIVSDLFGR